MAATMLGALHERKRTGQGRRLQLAMQDAMIHYMRTGFSNMARTGKPARRKRRQIGWWHNAPSGLYTQPKGDGPNDYVYLTTSRANPEHWSRLMKLIGREELNRGTPVSRPAISASRTRKNSTRSSANGPASTISAMRWRNSLPSACHPAPCSTQWNCRTSRPSRSAVSCRSCTHRQGDYTMATWPVRIDGKTVRLKPSPVLGGDSAEVLHNWLGIGDGEVEELRRDGVI